MVISNNRPQLPKGTPGPGQPPKPPAPDRFVPGPHHNQGMSTLDRVLAVGGLGTLGAVSGSLGGFLSMSSASQLSSLPYFALAGGLAGCALAAVMIVGEG